MIVIATTRVQHTVPSTMTVSSVKLSWCFECIIVSCRLHSWSCSCPHALFITKCIKYINIWVEISYANALSWLQISGVRGPSAGPSHKQYCSLSGAEGRSYPDILYILMFYNAILSNYHLFPASKICSHEGISLSLTTWSSAAGDTAFFVQIFINWTSSLL